MRSTIYYGCIIYPAAAEAKTSLQKVDQIQYRALRLCITAIKSTHIDAVEE